MNPFYCILTSKSLVSTSMWRVCVLYLIGTSAEPWAGHWDCWCRPNQAGRSRLLLPVRQRHDTTLSNTQKTQRGFRREKTANRNKQPLAGGASATTEPNEQGARVLGGAEPRRMEMTCPELQTSTFSHTIGPDTACQHHYHNIFPLQDGLCFTLAQRG